MELSKIAAAILGEYGLCFADAQRAGGWTNKVWLIGEYALRLAPMEGTERIRREVALSKHLPSAAGYPENIATGVMEGHEWSLSKRVQGVPLSGAWGVMRTEERTSAMRQIIMIAQHIRAVEARKVESLVFNRSWFSSFHPEESASAIEEIVGRGAISEAMGKEVSSLLRPFYSVLSTAPRVLNHGDITADNMLWHNGRITSLMDFEYALLAPAQFDLYSILLICLDPSAKTPEAPSLVEEIVQAAHPLLKRKEDAQLLLGFAALHSLKHMQLWLENRQMDETVEQSWPYRSLASLLDGKGGHFVPVIAHLGR